MCAVDWSRSSKSLAYPATFCVKSYPGITTAARFGFCSSTPVSITAMMPCPKYPCCIDAEYAFVEYKAGCCTYAAQAVVPKIPARVLSVTVVVGGTVAETGPLAEFWCLDSFTALFSSSFVTLGSSSTHSASDRGSTRSEEHTSELQSPCNLVCR